MSRVTCLCLLAITACGRKDRAPPPAPAPVPMFSAREIATLEAAVARHREDAKAMKCPRPVLHGTPTPGPADADILALTMPTTGTLAACMQRIGTAPETAFEQECGETLAAAVRAIAAHDDGCSALQLGRGPIPADQTPLVKAANIVGLHAEQAHDLWLLADAFRAYQDLGRGNVSMVTTTFIASAYLTLAQHALAVLATTKPKDAEDLAAAFDALLASEPHYTGTVRGELAAMADKLDAFEPTDAALAPSDRHAFALANVERLESLLVGACPETASYSACLTGLQKLREDVKSPAPSGPPTKTSVLAALAQRTLPHHDETIAARARGTSALIAVRVALATSGSGGARSTPKASAGTACAPPALPGVVPLLGAPLIAHVEAGALRLEPPAFAAKDGVEWIVKCDARARPPGPKNHQ